MFVGRSLTRARFEGQTFDPSHWKSTNCEVLIRKIHQLQSAWSKNPPNAVWIDSSWWIFRKGTSQLVDFYLEGSHCRVVVVEAQKMYWSIAWVRTTFQVLFRMNKITIHREIASSLWKLPNIFVCLWIKRLTKVSLIPFWVPPVLVQILTSLCPTFSSIKVIFYRGYL